MAQPLEQGDPRQLGSYTLRRRVGQGPLWQVFEGAGPGGSRVTLKLVHARLARDPDFRARFAEAVVSARAVRGDSVVPIVDADLDAERPWLATDFADESLSLAGFTTYGLPMRPSLVWRLANDLAKGLHEIHEAGVVHGALEPGTVLCSLIGPLFVTSDFGFSHLHGPPAQPADDIYSLGKVLLFAAAGNEADEHLGRLGNLIEACTDQDPLARPTASQVMDMVPASATQALDVPGRLPDAYPSTYAAIEIRNPGTVAAVQNGDMSLTEGSTTGAAARDSYSAGRDINITSPRRGTAPYPGTEVPLGERTDPLPHDGLFIRRNNAFGTKSTVGITDLIEQGVLIDQERIRFDDFVAARGDEIPPPAAGEAVGVSSGLARTAPDRRASQHATHFLEIALRAADPDTKTKTKARTGTPLPVNFVFVVDTSASMSGEKLATAKGAIQGLYDQLRDDDILGIVSFDTTVRTVLRSKRKSDLPPQEFQGIVDGLRAGGGTDLNLGVQYGIHEIERNAAGSDTSVNCLYLFSDGAPTSGERDWIQIRSNLAAELRGDITLSCFGFGADARMRELEALAGLTGGHCTFVSRPDEVSLNLTADLARREHLAAINIQLKIDIAPDVGIWHLYGHDLVTDPATRAAVLRDAAEAREQGEKRFGAESLPDLITEEKGVRIFAPDLAFGETYWVVLELAVPEGADTEGIGTATVQYVDAVARDARRREIPLGDSGEIPEAAVAGHAIGLWTSEVTFYALDDLYEGDRTTAKERLTRHRKILRDASQHVPAPGLADDGVVLAKLISLTGNLQQPRTWDDTMLGGGSPMRYTIYAMNQFGRVRGGYDRHYF